MKKLLLLSISLLLVFPAYVIAESIITDTAHVSAIGGSNISGDCDVDTSDNDLVPFKARTELYVDSTRTEVRLRVRFTVTEYGGDHTVIQGDYDRHVWRDAKNRKIKSVTANGGKIQDLHGETRGQNHRWNRFPISGGTYWDNPEFRNDSKGNDCSIVGLRGTIRFKVTVE